MFSKYHVIINQWILLLTHSDWLLKLGIVSCYFKLAEVVNKKLNLFSSLGFRHVHVCIKMVEILAVFKAAVTFNTKKTTKFSLAASEQ